ncbi:hypothetical protein ABPG72_006098 [Tetrahymena utriculariae]
MQDNLFSLKIIIHRVCLTKFAFKNDKGIIKQPGFQIKFVDFPYMIIMSRTSMHLSEFTDKQNLLNNKQEEVKAFGKGKSILLNAKYKDMVGYLDKYALVVQFKEFLKYNQFTVGKCLLNLDMFIQGIKYVITDDIERFKRNTFKLTDNENNCVGWFDMSISILQRPFSSITKQITKKLDSLQSQEKNDENKTKLNQQSSNNQQQQNGKILVVENFNENQIEIQKAQKKDDTKEEDKEAYKVTVMKASTSKEEEESLLDSGFKISEFQGPQSIRRKSNSQISVDNQQKNVKKTGQLQIIQSSSQKEMLTFGQDKFNQKSPKNNFQNSMDEYQDDFEFSNVQTSIQQQSTSYQQEISSRIPNLKLQQSTYTEENYDEDFESMSISQSHQLSKKQSQNTDRRKFNQSDQGTSKHQDDAISEVYTEDFESMSISQSLTKPKNNYR